MKLDQYSEGTYYQGLCSGCNARIEQIEIDPDEYLSKKWLCGHCRSDLESAQIDTLPVYMKDRWNKLQRELSIAEENIHGYERKIQLLEKVLSDHGINPQTIRDDGSIVVRPKPMFSDDGSWTPFMPPLVINSGEGDG